MSLARVPPALLLASAITLAGCSKPEAKLPYRLDNDMQTLMAHVLDPAADVVWAASGYVLTEEGEQDLSPKTEAEWEAVETGAATVTEVGNLLMMPGRALEDEPDWFKHTQALSAAGLRVQKAAVAHDKQGVFDGGGQVYEACVACHAQYVVGDPQKTVNEESGQ